MENTALIWTNMVSSRHSLFALGFSITAASDTILGTVFFE